MDLQQEKVDIFLMIEEIPDLVKMTSQAGLGVIDTVVYDGEFSPSLYSCSNLPLSSAAVLVAQNARAPETRIHT